MDSSPLSDASPVSEALANVSHLKQAVHHPTLLVEIARVEGMLSAVGTSDISLMDLDDALDEMLLVADSVTMDPTTKGLINDVHANTMDAVLDVMDLGEVTVEHPASHGIDGP